MDFVFSKLYFLAGSGGDPDDSYYGDYGDDGDEDYKIDESSDEDESGSFCSSGDEDEPRPGCSEWATASVPDVDYDCKVLYGSYLKGKAKSNENLRLLFVWKLSLVHPSRVKGWDVRFQIVWDPMKMN